MKIPLLGRRDPHDRPLPDDTDPTEPPVEETHVPIPAQSTAGQPRLVLTEQAFSALSTDDKARFNREVAAAAREAARLQLGVEVGMSLASLRFVRVTLLAVIAGAMAISAPALVWVGREFGATGYFGPNPDPGAANLYASICPDGIPTAWLFPLVVDGLAAISTFLVTILAERITDPRERFGLWASFFGPLAVTVGGNAAHAFDANQQAILIIAALWSFIAITPPLAVIAGTHSLILLDRHRRHHILERAQRLGMVLDEGGRRRRGQVDTDELIDRLGRDAAARAEQERTRRSRAEQERRDREQQDTGAGGGAKPPNRDQRPSGPPPPPEHPDPAKMLSTDSLLAGYAMYYELVRRNPPPTPGEMCEQVAAALNPDNPSLTYARRTIQKKFKPLHDSGHRPFVKLAPVHTDFA